MEPRLIIAYALIAGIVLAVALGLAYARYNTRDRKVARQREREDEARVKLIQDRI